MNVLARCGRLAAVLVLLAGCSGGVTATYSVTGLLKGPDGKAQVGQLKYTVRGSETALSSEFVGGKGTIPFDYRTKSSSESPGAITMDAASAGKLTVAAQPAGDKSVAFDVTFADGKTRRVEVRVGESTDVLADSQTFGVRIHVTAR
ncbi:MAG: hypothetical protein ACYTGN_09965 [Planctomycetota bacterium]|jgi:hypothetical protein